jgi:hypothetical protein
MANKFSFHRNNNIWFDSLKMKNNSRGNNENC